MSQTFSVGDRVRLRERGSETWIDPKLALRARRGTPATVRTIIGAACSASERSYRIEFDISNRMKPMTETIPVIELEAIDA